MYSNGPAEIVDPLIYEGFVEELVEVLETKEKGLMVSERLLYFVPIRAYIISIGVAKCCCLNGRTLCQT